MCKALTDMIKHLKLTCNLKIQFKNDIFTMQFLKSRESETRMLCLLWAELYPLLLNSYFEALSPHPHTRLNTILFFFF